MGEIRDKLQKKYHLAYSQIHLIFRESLIKTQIKGTCNIEKIRVMMDTSISRVDYLPGFLIIHIGLEGINFTSQEKLQKNENIIF